MEWLKKQEPEVAFDSAKLKTRADWIQAGELVFNAPVSYNPVFFSATDLSDRAFYEEAGMPVASDGTIPFARWVIRRKGQIELGSMGCNTCHTRVLPDGSVAPGAQGNNPGDREGARLLRRMAEAGDAGQVLEHARGFARQFEMPWLPDDPNRRARTMSLAELIAAGEAIPPGVTARSGTSMFLPPQIPDLIGVQERRYLDHTGVVRHRSIGDLMRYASLVQDIAAMDRYSDDAPRPAAGHAARYSDEQLYALALYLYSLRPPPNPNRFDREAATGKQIFERQGCADCHTAPLYTNNKLVPVDGFQPQGDGRNIDRTDVMYARLGLDPRYTLQTRKGTGYYKVPSLKGLWYRGPLGHNGAVATLEDWLDPARKAVFPGHTFGLHLRPEERQALIAFLKTL
jgi:hypothetical protein